MTGTQNVACLAGVTAAIDYVANIDSQMRTTRKEKLDASFGFVRSYESQLVQRLIDGLKTFPQVTLYGIAESSRIAERVPTVACNIQGYSSAKAAQALANHGIFVWHGNYYAIQLSRRLGQEPEGMIRIGLTHYNTPNEVDEMIKAIASL